MWAVTSKSARCGIAISNFDGKVKYGISLQVGDSVQIREECLGWYRGYATRNRELKGIFPVSYVKLKNLPVLNELSDGSVIYREDAIVSEVTSVLREWSIFWKKCYLKGRDEDFEKIGEVMYELMDYRRDFISGNLTVTHIEELKAKITAKIDWGNRILGLDLVPRCVDGSPADADRISPVELYRLHKASSRTSDTASCRGSIKPAVTSQIKAYHLHISISRTANYAGHDLELHINLFGAHNLEPISEQYIIQVSRSGKIVRKDSMPQIQQPATPAANVPSSNATANVVFADLVDKDWSNEVYLVAFVYRLGNLKESETSKAPTTTYKRPYGCGVQRVNDVYEEMKVSDMTDKEEQIKNLSLKVFPCTEGEFSQMYENLIKKQTTVVSKSTVAVGLNLDYSLKLLKGPLDRLKEEDPLLFRTAVISNKIGCSGVIMPDTLRNDLYLLPVLAELEKGSKSASKNIELRAVVLDKQGAVLANHIIPGAGQPGVSEYKTAVFYHCNNPHWTEMIRLSVPIEHFGSAHVRLELRHCSRKEKTEKKLVGFSFVKLSADDSTTLSDGIHELFLYKCDDANKLKSSVAYLVLPNSNDELTPNLSVLPLSHPHYKRSDKEKVVIGTVLCSTKLTQNADLLALLRWRENPEKIYSSLEKLMKLSGEETVKFLPDIMDALFNILSLDSSGRSLQAPLVFKALVQVFNLLEDSTFEHFKSVLDSYISNNLSALLAYRELLICLRDVTSDVTSTTGAPSLQEQFRRCFQVLEYVSKCIVQSRMLQIRALGASSQATDDFKKLLMSVFETMCRLLSLESDVITLTQLTLIDSLPKMLIQLTKLIPAVDLADVITMIISHIPRNNKNMDRPRLLFLHAIAKSTFFQQPESKTKLLPLFIAQLKRHLVTKLELKLCCSILSEILLTLYTNQQQNNSVRQDMAHVLDGLLDVLVEALLAIDKANPLVGELVSCLISMLRLVDESLYNGLIDRYTNDQPLKEFLQQILNLFQVLVEKEIYPRDWLQMRMTMNHVILITVQNISLTICSKFLNDNSFDLALWQNFFHLAVSFITQQSLQMEHFSSAKQQRIKERHGDMRVQMAYDVLSMWQNLGDRRIEFIPGMVGRFLEITLVPEDELRRVTLPILFEMMECEQIQHGSFHQVENELVDKLDQLVGSGYGDYEYRLLFNTLLLSKLHQVSSSPTGSAGSITSLSSISTTSSANSSASSSRTSSSWIQSGVAFVHSLTTLLERLLDYRNLMESEENREKRMTCTLNLLNFYKTEPNRRGMYIRYIYKLCDLHVACGNHTEAGLTLQLHADLLDWSDRLLKAETDFPIQPEWQRKEALFMRIIKEFDIGKAWEYGLPLCEKLSAVYKERILYDRLSNILKIQSDFYQKILKQHRPEPEYFRVGFYGQRFPLFLRNKEFIYRGIDYEKLEPFQQRLLSEFVGATLLNSNRPPCEQLTMGDNQCIQICSARPLSDADPSLLADTVPDAVRSFYRVNNISRFQIDRPFHRGDRNECNEFQTLYLERITLTTTNPLPGLLRWFEVERSTTIQLTPIEVAIDTMTSKNLELKAILAQYTPDLTLTSKPDHPPPNVNPLTMKLNGVIDAAVMGGIAKYQEAFFTEQYRIQHPEHADYLHSLKMLFLEQIQILEAALPVHKRLAPPNVQPLHNRLENLFGDMKQRIKDPEVFWSKSTPPGDRRNIEGDTRSNRGSTASLSSIGAVSCGSNRSSGVYCGSTTDVNTSNNSDKTSNGESSTLPKNIGSKDRSSSTGGRKTTLTLSQTSPLASPIPSSAPSSATPEHGGTRWWSVKSLLPTSRSREGSGSRRDKSPSKWYVEGEESLHEQQREQQSPQQQGRAKAGQPFQQHQEKEQQELLARLSVVKGKQVRPQSAECSTNKGTGNELKVSSDRKNLSEPQLTSNDESSLSSGAQPTGSFQVSPAVSSRQFSELQAPPSSCVGSSQTLHTLPGSQSSTPEPPVSSNANKALGYLSEAMKCTGSSRENQMQDGITFVAQGKTSDAGTFKVNFMNNNNRTFQAGSKTLDIGIESSLQRDKRSISFKVNSSRSTDALSSNANDSKSTDEVFTSETIQSSNVEPSGTNDPNSRDQILRSEMTQSTYASELRYKDQSFRSEMTAASTRSSVASIRETFQSLTSSNNGSSTGRMSPAGKELKRGASGLQISGESPGRQLETPVRTLTTLNKLKQDITGNTFLHQSVIEETADEIKSKESVRYERKEGVSITAGKQQQQHEIKSKSSESINSIQPKPRKLSESQIVEQEIAGCFSNADTQNSAINPILPKPIKLSDSDMLGMNAAGCIPLADAQQSGREDKKILDYPKSPDCQNPPDDQKIPDDQKPPELPPKRTSSTSSAHGINAPPPRMPQCPLPDLPVGKGRPPPVPARLSQSSQRETK